MLACIGESASFNDRCPPKPQTTTARQKRPASARTSSASYTSGELEQRVTDLLVKFNVIAPNSLVSPPGSGCSASIQKKRPQSARPCLEKRFVETASSNQAGTSSCSSKGSNRVRKRPQSAAGCEQRIVHASNASNTSARLPRRPQSARDSEQRVADKDHLTVEDARKILDVLLDAKRRQQGQPVPVPATEQAQSSRSGSYMSGIEEKWMKALGIPSKGYTSSRGVTESTRASTERSSDIHAAQHRIPRDWLESLASPCSNSPKSVSRYSHSDERSVNIPWPQSNVNAGEQLDDQGAGSPSTHITPALWHLQTGPEHALWGRHKKTYEHGSYLFQTGAWADRMGTGTGSIVKYKQWGPSGPQFAIEQKKGQR